MPKSLLRFCAGLLLVGAPSFSFAQTPAPLQVLYISGGCCHDYDAQADLIPQGLEERANVKVTVINDPNKTTAGRIAIYENEDWAKGYDVIIHNECYSDTADPAWTQRILKPHKAGVPGVVIHCAMHCYRDGTDEWFQFCGVTSRSHDAHYPHGVFNVNAEHPVMAGFGAAWANPAGELYRIEKIWPGVTPLASAISTESGKENVCVWTHDYGGRARVFGTTLGHHNETVVDPAFMNTLTRGTLWAAGKLDPVYLKETGVKEVPVNLALGKKGTASSTQEGRPVGDAFDGKPGTRWCANGPSKPQWLAVDLGEPQTLTGAKLVWETAGVSYQYLLEGSADGQTWTTLLDSTKNTDKGEQSPRFSAEGIRHVRVTCTNASGGNDAWTSLYEMEVYGTKTTRLDPAAARKEAEEKALAEVGVPEGFEKTLFATPPAASYPVYVTASPAGEVFVSVDKNGSLDREKNRGSILRLRDADGDGRADETKVFVSSVDSPRGAVWDHNTLYLVHPPHLSAFIDRDGDGVSDQQKVLVKNIAFDFKDRPADHTTNGLTLGIDGWLYVAVGDFGMMRAEGTDGTKLQVRGGGVLRLRPDGSELQVYSSGTRNILDVAMSPALDGFTRDNTNDGGGWDMRFHHFTGLEDHGYPRLYMNFGDEIIQPLAEYGGGSGCGGAYLNEPGFPETYRDLPLTCDWGRERVFSHHITPHGATFKDDVREFIRLPRVTDIDVDANSHLYVASWKGASFTYAGEDVGYIVRVSPKGHTPEPLPDFDITDDAGLVKLLESPSARRRQEAQRALLRRGVSEPAARLLFALASDPSKALYPRIAAIFTLEQGLGAASLPALEKLAGDESVRAFAVRAMTDRPSLAAAAPEAVLRAAAADTNPRTKIEAAVAIARTGNARLGDAVAPLLGDADPVIAHTAFRAVAQLHAHAAAFAVVDSGDASPAARAGALRALMRIHEPGVVDGLITRLEKETDTSRRNGLLGALCRLHYTEGEWKGDSWGTRPDTRGPYYQPATWAESAKIYAFLDATLKTARGDELAFLVSEIGRNRIANDNAIAQIVNLAAKDASMLPKALSQLAAAENISPEAVALLIGALSADGTEPSARSQAIIILAKTDSADAVRATLAALPRFKAGDARDTAVKAWLGAPKLENHHALLEAEAEKVDPATGRWADAALLALASRTSGSPESRDLTAAALTAGWELPARRVQILQAVALTAKRSWSDKVLTALADTDPAVVSAAKDAAAALKLDPNAKPSPLVETLSVEEALEAVVKEKGDPAVGRQIFTQATCAACHTVSKDEPQRGPFLGNIADTYKRRELAESILDPNKTIAQGFATNFFQLKDGNAQMGFVTREGADKIVIRTITAEEITLNPADITSREKVPTSLMPPGLMNKLTVRDFASLLDYLQLLAKEQKK